MEREHAGVCLPLLWPSNSTQGLHQTHEASDSFTATRGFRLIIYSEDIRLMAESRHLALFQAASILNLLESLGFIVNYKKSQLDPVQQLEFLGVLVDTRDLSLHPSLAR